MSVNVPIFIGGGGEGYTVFGQDLTDAVEPYVRRRPGGGDFFTHREDGRVKGAVRAAHDANSRCGRPHRQYLSGEAAMMRKGLLLVASVSAASCNRADYVIDLKRGHIEQASRTGGSGYVIVSKASADTMAKYGDVYIEGRSCPDVRCKSFPVGTLRRHDATAVKDGVRLNIEPLFLAENDQKYLPFWLKNVACIKVEAMQGFMGRTGRSAWNCSVTHRSS